MTGPLVTAEAQWALHGGPAGRADDRVLACSAGELTAPTFDAAIRRFDPETPGAPGPAGLPDGPPQVTVSYLTPATWPGESLLAMAIHAHRQDGGDEQRTAGEDGRGSLLTSYFCVPYQRLASAAISYRGMHAALGAIRLPAENGPPLPVTMTGTGPGTPAVDDLALQAAALLLTGRPVCVLGGRDVGPADRLAFIDTVMTLLPYGLRARMSATTWTTAANQDRRFRLYFSDAARAADPPDHVLHWGQPGLRTRIDGYPRKYLDWLEGTVSQPTAELAKLSEPMRFSPKSILQMLDLIGVASQDNPGLNYSVTGQDWLHPAPPPPTGAVPGAAAPILRGCDTHVRAGDQRAVKSDIGALMGITEADDQHRAHYREIIKETGLLNRAEDLGRLAGRLYEQLLRVAFTVPLSYQGYLQVEDCLGGAPLRPALHQAIDGVGMADPWVQAIVYWSLRGVRGRPRKDSGRQRLTRWYGSGQLDAIAFVNRLSAGWARPDHARIICDVTVDFLKDQPRSGRPEALRAALKQHGFLAHALQANQIGNASYRAQVVLRRLLTAAYPGGLDEAAVIEILAGGSAPPTSALLAAVLMLTTPAQRRLPELAWQAYLRGSIGAMELDEQTRGILAPLLPALDGRAATGAGR